MLSYAIDLADEEDILNLRDNIQRARRKIENNIVAIDENVDFHNLLAKAAKNHVFVIVVGSIMAVVRDHASRLASNLEESSNVAILSESVLLSKNAVDIHEEIVNAIKDKDREKAIRLIESHVREVGHRLESLKD